MSRLSMHMNISNERKPSRIRKNYRGLKLPEHDFGGDTILSISPSLISVARNNFSLWKSWSNVGENENGCRLGLRCRSKVHKKNRKKVQSTSFQWVDSLDERGQDVEIKLLLFQSGFCPCPGQDWGWPRTRQGLNTRHREPDSKEPEHLKTKDRTLCRILLGTPKSSRKKTSACGHCLVIPCFFKMCVRDGFIQANEGNACLFQWGVSGESVNGKVFLCNCFLNVFSGATRHFALQSSEGSLALEHFCFCVCEHSDCIQCFTKETERGPMKLGVNTPCHTRITFSQFIPFSAHLFWNRGCKYSPYYVGL